MLCGLLYSGLILPRTFLANMRHHDLSPRCSAQSLSLQILQFGQELPGLASILAEEGPDSLVSLQDLLTALALLCLAGELWQLTNYAKQSLHTLAH